MAEPVASLLRRSLGNLADEVPASYRHLVEQMGSLVVQIVVGSVGGEATHSGGEEHFTVIGGQHLVVRDGVHGSAQVRIRTDRQAILDVIEARVGLHEAVEHNRVEATGSLDDLVWAHDALMAYAHAAVRAPSVPGLLAELRTSGSVRTP